MLVPVLASPNVLDPSCRHICRSGFETTCSKVVGQPEERISGKCSDRGEQVEVEL